MPFISFIAVKAHALGLFLTLFCNAVVILIKLVKLMYKLYLFIHLVQHLLQLCT
jgi:hypothetical protein